MPVLHARTAVTASGTAEGPGGSSDNILAGGSDRICDTGAGDAGVSGGGADNSAPADSSDADLACFTEDVNRQELGAFTPGATDDASDRLAAAVTEAGPAASGPHRAGPSSGTGGIGTVPPLDDLMAGCSSSSSSIAGEMGAQRLGAGAVAEHTDAAAAMVAAAATAAAVTMAAVTAAVTSGSAGDVRDDSGSSAGATASSGAAGGGFGAGAGDQGPLSGTTDDTSAAEAAAEQFAEEINRHELGGCEEGAADDVTDRAA